MSKKEQALLRIILKSAYFVQQIKQMQDNDKYLEQQMVKQELILETLVQAAKLRIVK